MEPLSSLQIIGHILTQLIPVWIGMALIFAVSISTKQRTGLYGKLFDSPIGMFGFALVLFWVLTAVLGDMIMTHDPLSQVSGMKNKVPGTPLRGAEEGDYQWYLLGGDNLARDVFSRVVAGSQIVLVIAPLATVFAFMMGITLGLPAGYYGGRSDTILSFLANLILAFPVILLFYLLVTPEIVKTGLPKYMAGVLFLFPLIFIWVLMYSRFRTRQKVMNRIVIPVTLALLLLYLGTIWRFDPFIWFYTSMGGYLNQGNEIGGWMQLTADSYSPLISLNPDDGVLIVFVAVVFVNSPTVYRIVRGITLDIKTRDYVAAAQTRGEGPWYIMLWEILPNARGPLIVDFCLRIGYTTILLGTLGFFGLGLESESPDWGSTINAGRKLLSIYAHPALPPALSLMSLVLGLNLLADGLREQSLKD
ncbi:MAG: ABC transporter permease [Rhodobacteraceae bacterium]|nr:ABC transporter permease [Paracoccaceae bacterium]